MNGPHDMGGFTRFGPIDPETDEPLYHAAWEPRVMAMSVAMGATGAWNIDMNRHARESRPAVDYWSASYYDKWLYGLIKLLTDHGLATPEEVARGRALTGAKMLKRVLQADMVSAVLAKGSPYGRPAKAAARFQGGDQVLARNLNPEGHTRIPRYVRGRRGRIAAIHGAHVFPDSNAAGRGEDPQWLYTVSFTVKELWGHATADTVQVDLWEPYLEASP